MEYLQNVPQALKQRKTYLSTTFRPRNQCTSFHFCKIFLLGRYIFKDFFLMPLNVVLGKRYTSWGWAGPSSVQNLPARQANIIWFLQGFHWGQLPLCYSSLEVLFGWGCLPLRSSNIEVLYHWCLLPLRLSSIEVVLHWCCLKLRSSFI